MGFGFCRARDGARDGERDGECDGERDGERELACRELACRDPGERAGGEPREGGPRELTREVGLREPRDGSPSPAAPAEDTMLTVAVGQRRRGRLALLWTLLLNVTYCPPNSDPLAPKSDSWSSQFWLHSSFIQLITLLIMALLISKTD